jgi:hypothetical protein
VGELASAEALLEAARAVRREGFARCEAYTPFPVDGLDELLEVPRSRAPLIVLLCGIAGAATAFFGQWWCNGIDFPIDVGGRPLFSWPAWIIITFELTVLFAGFGALVGCLRLCGLPRLWDPVFEVDGFESATLDAFWIAVEADDARAEGEAARSLERLGARRIAVVDARGATMLGTSARPEAAT